MDPTDVLRVLWQQRWYVIPALLLALGAAAYVYQFAPRSYETTATYALVNPAVPTSEELERDPGLAALNGDNPYLRSADTNLIADAVIARLTASSTVETLEAAGIGTDYGVGPGVGGNGFVVDITGVGPTPEDAIATTTAVGAVLETELRALQKVNGADDRYLFVPLLLAGPEGATEQFSSRLRAVIMVLLAGAVLVFAAASLGRYRGRARAARAVPAEGRDAVVDPGDPSAAGPAVAGRPATAPPPTTPAPPETAPPPEPATAPVPAAPPPSSEEPAPPLPAAARRRADPTRTRTRSAPSRSKTPPRPAPTGDDDASADPEPARVRGAGLPTAKRRG
ncbi:hypothetical protein [Cellulomonas sp. Marseille-Q8402]